MKVVALAVFTTFVFLAYGQSIAGQNIQASLKKHVTLQPPYPQSYKDAPVDKLSIQYAVIEVLKQVEVRYNWNASFKNTDPICCKWVKPDIVDMECDKALETILDPLGLTYLVENEQVVLQKAVTGKMVEAPTTCIRELS